jgi:ankyrin repeat protein
MPDKLLTRRQCELLGTRSSESVMILHPSLLTCSPQIVQVLIERGCQYNVKNNEGFTPLDYAYSYVKPVSSYFVPR